YQPELIGNFGERFMSSYSTFFLVAEDFDPASIKPISEDLFRDHIQSGFGQATGNVDNLRLSHDLQKLDDLRFGPQLVGTERVGSIMNLYIFAAVVVALLLSSCINYVNLATARSATRTREVAIKRLLGAENRHLILQFIGESVFMVGLAFVVGIFLAEVIIEVGIMEDFTGKSELSQLLLSPGSIPLLIISWLLISVLAGIYPALQLSKPSMMALMSPL